MIMITGASGFIGSKLCEELRSKNINYVSVSRGSMPNSKKHFNISDINQNTDWSEPLQLVKTVVHTAARVHVMDDPSNDPGKEFDQVNFHGTVNLAMQCIDSKIKRFIFLSSIKVNGESTEFGKPFFNSDSAFPQDPYAFSKFQAEEALKKLCKNSEMDLVIVRLPLVYGPGVKGNFALMIKAIRLNLPLPLRGIRNSRSLISIYNLTDFLIECIKCDKTLNDTFLVSDDEDISTPELLTKLSYHMKKRVIIFNLPNFVLINSFCLINRRKEINRLTGNLEVDIHYTKEKLNWISKYSIDDSLNKMFLEQL